MNQAPARARPGPGGTGLSSSRPCCQTPSVGSARPQTTHPPLPCPAHASRGRGGSALLLCSSASLEEPGPSPCSYKPDLASFSFLHEVFFDLSFFFFLIKCWETELACGFVLRAGGETVGFCLSWRPSVGARVTPCGVSEDLRWSRAAMSNPSMRLGGSTFKTFRSHPLLPIPTAPDWSKLPLSLAWTPFLPWLPSASSHHGRHRDSVNKHGGPCPHSVQNGPELHGQQTPSCLPALYCPKCTAVNCAPVQC